MKRNFTDRIFGGVCGGLGATLRINSWLIRAAFVLLTILTMGAFALLYLILWWLLPQESLVIPRTGNFGRSLLALALIVLVAGGYALRWIQPALLTTAAGQDLYWPALLLLTSVVFTLRQVRG
jgi:phage shock protein PspC (stress-responsive transcriptional regulator)